MLKEKKIDLNERREIRDENREEINRKKSVINVPSTF